MISLIPNVDFIWCNDWIRSELYQKKLQGGIGPEGTSYASLGQRPRTKSQIGKALKGRPILAMGNAHRLVYKKFLPQFHDFRSRFLEPRKVLKGAENELWIFYLHTPFRAFLFFVCYDGRCPSLKCLALLGHEISGTSALSLHHE